MEYTVEIKQVKNGWLVEVAATVVPMGVDLAPAFYETREAATAAAINWLQDGIIPEGKA